MIRLVFAALFFGHGHCIANGRSETRRHFFL